jgi:short subunit fatty acids transporter
MTASTGIKSPMGRTVDVMNGIIWPIFTYAMLTTIQFATPKPSGGSPHMEEKECG